MDAPATDAPAAAGAEPVSRRDMPTLVKQELATEAALTPLKEVPTCLTLFDKWLSCYALGPQIRHAYRHGTAADCATRREDFKFCLTLRQLDPEARRAEWLQRRAEIKAEARHGFHSSENVWSLRDTPLLDPALVDPAYPPP